MQPDTYTLHLSHQTTIFSAFNHSFWTGLPQKLLRSECGRLSLLSPDNSGGVTAGDCPFSYCGRGSWGRRRHLPAVLPLVYQWRMWLGCTGYIRSSQGWCYNYLLLHFCLSFSLSYLLTDSYWTALSCTFYICFSFCLFIMAVRLIFTSCSTMMTPHFYDSSLRPSLQVYKQ